MALGREEMLSAQFIGFKLAAGEKLDLKAALNELGLLHKPHITNVALGPNPKPGRHTVFAQHGGAKAVIGNLEAGRCEQFVIDLPCDVTFSHTGKSEVFLSGYATDTVTQSSLEEGLYEDESDEDDLDVPQAVPLRQAMPSKAAVAKQRALIDDVADEDDEDSEEEDDDEDEEYSDEEEDDDDDDIARSLAGAPNLKTTLRSKPFNGKGPLIMDDVEEDDEDDDEDDDESDEEEEDDEEDDELVGLPGMSDEDMDDESDEDEDEAAAGADLVQALQAAGAKRAAPRVTPQPAKKAKVTAAKANVVPASAPAAAASKTQPAAASAAGQQGLTEPAAAQWLSALKQFLTQSGGQADMSKLGGVKKPEGVAKGQKLKAFLLQNSKTFAIDGNDVTLKK